MATDYNIYETELKDLKTKLKRDLHMHRVHRLSKKQFDLAKGVVQRRQIENLTKLVAELEPTVTTVYCPQNVLKDEEIRSYLVYLLKMKDYFARAVVTKQEMIEQIEEEIKGMLLKLCVATNETAKIKRSAPVKSPEFVQVENLSDRLNQMNKRICTMRQDNKELMENIMSMRKFQRQFRNFERDFRHSITFLKEEIQKCLSKAVATYEEKEEFMNRERVLRERCVKDLRKVTINTNALNLCLSRSEKNEIFRKIQDTARTDSRIAQTGDLIERGTTGIEPILECTQDLHSAIADAAEERTPEKMEEIFKLGDDHRNALFSYLTEMSKDINDLQVSIGQAKSENEELIKNMTESDKKMRKDIKRNQAIVQMKLEDADRVSKARDEERSELDSLLEYVKSLYTIVCPEDEISVQEKPVDDSNVMDYLQNIEKRVLDYLICVEYIRMKEASQEESEQVVLDEEEDEDEDVDDDTPRIETLSPIQPLRLESVSDLPCLKDLEQENSFLEFEELMERSVTPVTETVSQESEEEDIDRDSTTVDQE